MAWPSDTLTNTNTDQATDRPDLARSEINSCILMVKTILGEAPAGSTLLTSADEGHGGGINADQLDGLHGSSYAYASHAHDAAAIISGTLPVSRGGTGRTSFTNTNGPLYYDGANFSAAHPSTAGYVLTSNGSGSAPTYQALPAAPTVDVHASDFWDTTINFTTSSGNYNTTVNTGFATSNFVFGFSGALRSDGVSSSIYSVVGVSSAGHVLNAEGGASGSVPGVTTVPSTPGTAGQIAIQFHGWETDNRSWALRVWARKLL